MPSKPLASIDIGTNTFRLLIAEVSFDLQIQNYTFRVIHSERAMTRLGEGVHETGFMNRAAMTRGIETLKRFHDVISRCNAVTSAVATGVLRDARNSTSFLQRARDEAGLNVTTVSGEEEARMAASGMLIDIPVPDTSLMADIGGGSTELVLTQHRSPSLVKSLGLGVVYLADKYMRVDPPPDKDLHLMGDEVTERILSVSNSMKKHLTGNSVFIGTAGTVTALSAIAQDLRRFDHKRIHNSKLEKRTVERIFSILSALPVKERSRYLPFESSRLDIIIPGTLILLKLFDIFEFREITVSNYGLLEGILLKLHEKTCEKT